MGLRNIFKRKPKEAKEEKKEEKKVEKEEKKVAKKVEKEEAKTKAKEQAKEKINEEKASKEKAVSAEGKPETPSETATLKKKPSKASGEIYKILREPHITEKGTNLAKEGQHIFKVSKRANKSNIKKAIEDFYQVKVASVRIINISRRRRTLGKIKGWRKGYKKAIVRLKPGEKIETLQRKHA